MSITKYMSRVLKNMMTLMLGLLMAVTPFVFFDFTSAATASINFDVVASVSHPLMEGASSVAVLGATAYVSGPDAGAIAAVDVNDPLSPFVDTNVSISNIRELNGMTSLTAYNGYLYTGGVGTNEAVVLQQSSGTITDLSLQRPNIQSNIGQTAVTIYDNKLFFVSSDSMRIVVYPLDNSGSTIRQSFGYSNFTTLDGAADLAIANDYAYVPVFNTDEIAVFDVSDVDFGGAGLIVMPYAHGSALTKPSAIDIYDDYAYVTSFDGSLYIFDIATSPQNPQIVGSIADGDLSGATGLYVKGNTAYVVTVGGRITALNVSNPSAISIIDSLNDSDLYGASDVTINGRYAYVSAANRDALTVVDLNAPVVSGGGNNGGSGGSTAARRRVAAGKAARVRGDQAGPGEFTGFSHGRNCPVFAKNLYPGDIDTSATSDIRLLQNILNFKKHGEVAPGVLMPMDGIYGSKTRGAVERYQASNYRHLVIWTGTSTTDGIFGRYTRNLMNMQLGCVTQVPGFTLQS